MQDPAPDCPAWLKPILAAIIVAIGSGLVNIYSTVSKNTDKIAALQQDHSRLDSNGSRHVEVLRAQMDGIVRDVDRLQERLDRLGERQDNVHRFLSNFTYFKPDKRPPPEPK